MTKTNEVSEALDNVIAKGDDFLGKAKDFVAATSLKALLDKNGGTQHE